MRSATLLSLIFLLSFTGCNQNTREETDSVKAEDAQTEKTKSEPSEEIRIGPAPKWAKTSKILDLPDDATGLVFLKRNDLIVHLSKAGQSTYQNQYLKLLDSRALEIGNLSLTWNPGAGSPIVHKLRLHRDGNIIDILEDNVFEVIRREDQLEQAMLNGFLTAVLRVPDLRVGDELEWSYTLPSHDPTLGDRSFGIISMAGAQQSGAHNVTVSWQKGQEPTLYVSDDLTKFRKETPRSLSIQLTNPEIANPPKDAPLRYSWMRFVEYSDFESWPAVSKHFYNLFDEATRISSKSNIEDEIKRIKKAHSNDIERAKAALALVQRQVRYIYVGLNGGNFTPATAEETWERRYGDCKGKSALLMSLLRGLDIEAELILVSNSGVDDGLDARLPSPALFDHVIVRANINDQNYWLDPTLPDVIEPSFEPIIPYRWVLPLATNGKTLEPLEAKIYQQPQEMGIIEYDAREGFDKSAKVSHVTVKRGVDGLAEYIRYSALSPEQLKSAFLNALVGSDQWDTIEDVSYRYDKASQASILTLNGVGPVDWDKGANGRFDLTLPGGGFIPPSRRQRFEEQYKDVPFYMKPNFSCHVTTVRLPKDTNINNWGHNTSYHNELFGRKYYRMMERKEDHSIRMVRASRVEQYEITTEKAEQDNTSIEAFDNSKATINYNPNRLAIPYFSKSSVPATYEIDWTHPNAPCLPDDKSFKSKNTSQSVTSSKEGFTRTTRRVMSPQESLEFMANEGDSEAQYELGLQLLRDNDGSSDDAVEWLEKAAAQGHEKSNLELGKYYTYQQENLKKAVKYLESSNDEAEGIYLLADIYFVSPNLFPNVSDARIMELYHISAENDHRNAQRALAQRYKDGSMVKRDEIEALKWAFIANGFESQSNDRLKTEMSGSDIEVSRAKANTWIKSVRQSK